jgi:hypothetical protein
MAQILSFVNLGLVFVIVYLLVYIWMLDKSLVTKMTSLEKNIKVQEMKKTDLVVDKTYKDIYKQQTYNFRVEDYFASDIYSKIPEDQRGSKVQSDYFALFVQSIQSVFHNESFYVKHFQQLDKPVALANSFYIPIVKFAKFSVDYEGYLETTSQREFAVRVEVKYPKFGTDEKYFVTLDNGKCKKRVHITYFIEKALKLYKSFKKEVDDCIYYNKCKIVKKQHSDDETTSKCEL